MDFLPEFLVSSCGKEFVAGGMGGIAGTISGYPLDTLRIMQQHSNSGSASGILRKLISKQGPASLYKGMAAPLASVTFQNAMVFQSYAIMSRKFDKTVSANNPPSYKGVVLGGICAGAMQSFLISPVELVKIRLQLRTKSLSTLPKQKHFEGPICVVKNILRNGGLPGIYRGLGITILRDAPSHGLYFWTYEYTKEKLHPGCRKTGEESLRTMLIAGGVAGVASWVCCYPLDVVKTRIQAQTPLSPHAYKGMVDCFLRSVRKEGYHVLWRGLGSTVSRAFVVNGAIFSAYEITLRCLFNHGNLQTENTI